MDDAAAAPFIGSVKAWWSGSLRDFFEAKDEHIVGQLAACAMQAYRTNEAAQLRAWVEQLELLRPALSELPQNWRLLLEYPLIRLGRRLDAVLVTDRAIIVIEFKTLGGSFTTNARIQAEDYAHDLRDFHAGSRDQVIVPILVAGTGKPTRPQWAFPWPGVSVVYDALPKELPSLLQDILTRLPPRDIHIATWEHAAYRPVPTIIEAARALYEKHGVAEIKAARADTANLSRTTAAILQAVQQARDEHKYFIVFVTGIPGAGKTLCGLDVVFSSEAEGTFLTGTLPMVYVLKAALAEDAARAGTRSGRTARHESKAKIESITGFLRDNMARAEEPAEHVIVFDEAQRAWDAEYGARKFKHTMSEAAIVLEIMQRHRDYAVIVALVGNGQEINTGEAGLAEWGKALAERPRWQIRAAPGVLTAAEPRQRLFDKPPAELVVDPDLHLDIPIRNIRSPAAAKWIDAVLRGNRDEALQYAGNNLPIFVTRSLEEMRRHLRHFTRGERRAGLVCSSGAKRLVADGIWPKFDHMDDATVANWFLKRWPDVRASDALEIPATEFACQGLELDFVGLCWGGDLLWKGEWRMRKFRGKDWNNVKQENERAYVLNTYRVLLTRARADTIIWIPPGETRDKTRSPEEFDETAAFLLSCGARQLSKIPAEQPEPTLL
jgi:hypothetical protein